MKDNVNHPSHYTDRKIEVISYIEDKNLNYHRGNAVKYISRAGKKNADKEIEDLEKARWYINREIERITGQKRKQVHIALEEGVAEKRYYLILNESFCIEITKQTFYELADFVSIDVKK